MLLCLVVNLWTVLPFGKHVRDIATLFVPFRDLVDLILKVNFIKALFDELPVSHLTKLSRPEDERIDIKIMHPASLLLVTVARYHAPLSRAWDVRLVTQVTVEDHHLSGVHFRNSSHI